MSFIKESKDAYRKVKEALEKETSDHEISMARGELETIADRALATSAMLEGTPEDGNPLPAWVQSKITNACDYITTVHDYLKYSPKLNESTDLTETTFEKIYQMQQDGKTADDIAKELKLNPALVKKVLGEQVELKEFTDAQIAQLKKEFDPLKGKQISTARANQLSNILNKLDDASLEKLKSALIPFVSALAAAKTTQRKFRGVKITNVTVPGLEGMAEAVDPSKATKLKMISIKGDQKEITIDKKDLEKYLKLDYVIKEYLPEENPGDAVVNMAKRLGLDNYGYARYGKDNVVTHRQFGGTLQKLDKPFKLDKPLKKEEAELKPVPSLEEGAKRYKEMSNVGTAKYLVSFHDGIKKHNDGSDFFDIQIFKNKEEKNKFITDLEGKGYRPVRIGEEVELKPVPSLEDSAKKHNVDIETLKKQLSKGIEIEKEHTKDEKVAEKIALAHIDERPDYYIQIDKLEKKPIEKVNEVKEPTGELKDACWTGYVAVGFKMKNGKRVPNCVPKSEAYKGAKKIVEKAWKKLKEKK